MRFSLILRVMENQLIELAVRALLGLIVLSPAVWRITSLLVYEEGPWDVFPKLRYWLGVRYDDMNYEPYGTNVVADAFTCMWCLSPYVGAVIMVVWLVFPWSIFVFLPFSFSAVAIIIEAVAREK